MNGLYSTEEPKAAQRTPSGGLKRGFFGNKASGPAGVSKSSQQYYPEQNGSVSQPASDGSSRPTAAASLNGTLKAATGRSALMQAANSVGSDGYFGEAGSSTDESMPDLEDMPAAAFTDNRLSAGDEQPAAGQASQVPFESASHAPAGTAIRAQPPAHSKQQSPGGLLPPLLSHVFIFSCTMPCRGYRSCRPVRAASTADPSSALSTCRGVSDSCPQLLPLGHQAAGPV